MKTKITIIACSLSLALIFSACKKEEKIPASSPVTTSTSNSLINITLLNDTVDFSATSNCFEWSVGMDFDSVHSDLYSASDYSIQSKDSNCVFTNNPKLEFKASNNSTLFLDDNLGGNVKKYMQGETIDYNTVLNTTSSSGAVSARILEVGVTNDFNLNETFYLGTSFLQNGSYYNGWVKIKTLNNYYSCIIVSYGVSKTANTAITAE